MRHNIAPYLTLLLWACTSSAFSFEIEEKVRFDVSDPTSTISIISTADAELFSPIVRSFQTANPNVAVDYIVTGSQEIMTAIVEERETFDLVVSSAMDLQTKLANDGFARSYQSSTTEQLPDWGRWRNSVFAFTQEPAAIVLSRTAFGSLNTPNSREELLEAIRAQPERFEGRIGTYDIRASGLGYLFATQDSRTSDRYWRFIEVLGNIGTQLYTASSDMIDDVATGNILVAYNVLGSYAAARADVEDDIIIVEPKDYTTVMLRSALLMNDGASPEDAELFLDHLLDLAWSKPKAPSFLFPNKTEEEVDQATHIRPIKLGPGLLVHLDNLKRTRFIKDWEASLVR